MGRSYFNFTRDIQMYVLSLMASSMSCFRAARDKEPAVDTEETGRRRVRIRDVAPF